MLSITFRASFKFKRIFGVYIPTRISAFGNLVHLIVVQFSMSDPLWLSPTAFTLYHSVLPLSIPFSKFFSFFSNYFLVPPNIRKNRLKRRFFLLSADYHMLYHSSLGTYPSGYSKFIIFLKKSKWYSYCLSAFFFPVIADIVDNLLSAITASSGNIFAAS